MAHADSLTLLRRFAAALKAEETQKENLRIGGDLLRAARARNDSAKTQEIKEELFFADRYLKDAREEMRRNADVLGFLPFIEAGTKADVDAVRSLKNIFDFRGKIAVRGGNAGVKVHAEERGFKVIEI